MGACPQGFPLALIPSSLCITCFSFIVLNLTIVSFVYMAHRARCATNNSVAAMLDSSQPSSSAHPPSSVTSSSIYLTLVTTPRSFVPSQQDLSQTFSQALGNMLVPRVLVALQSHSLSSSAAGNMTLDWLFLLLFQHTACGQYSSLSLLSLFGSCGATNGAPSSNQSFTPLFSYGCNSSIACTSTSLATSSMNRPFVVGPVYSPIPGKLVIKISKK